MKIFVTGGTGFVGRALLKALCQKGHSILALVRPGSEKKIIPGVEIALGNVLDPPAILAERMAGCEAIIHLVGIIREFPGRDITFSALHVRATEHIVSAAHQAGIKRYLHMASLGTRPEATSAYHQSKWAAEEIVRSSNLEWTIFRPSVIFGPEDSFVNLLAEMIRKVPLVPIIGDGTYRLQPVAVEVVAEAFSLALEMPETVGKVYEVCGPEPLSYNTIVDHIAQAMGKRVLKIHLPVFLMRLLASLLGRFAFFPLTVDQITMLLEENVCQDTEAFYQTFDLPKVTFKEGIQRYVNG
ncbi:complex I NDUFA9 subunit family protein [Thermosulfuriphilus sp.]